MTAARPPRRAPLRGDVWVLIPVKPLSLGKSRLAGILDRPARRALSERLLRHVLGVAIATVGAQRTILVSRDPAVQAIARQAGAVACRERGRPDLNRALAQAVRHAAARRARTVVILFGDLPRLTADEVRRLIAGATGPAPAVAAATDRAATGTNALVLTPPGAIRPEFGRASLRRHRQAARRSGCRWRLVPAPGLAFDVDRPADWRALTGG